MSYLRLVNEFIHAAEPAHVAVLLVCSCSIRHVAIPRVSLASGDLAHLLLARPTSIIFSPALTGISDSYLLDSLVQLLGDDTFCSGMWTLRRIEFNFDSNPNRETVLKSITNVWPRKLPMLEELDAPITAGVLNVLPALAGSLRFLTLRHSGNSRVYGDQFHANLSKMTRLEALKLVKVFSQFPVDLGEQLPRLRSLILSDCGAETCVHRALRRGFNNLQELVIEVAQLFHCTLPTIFPRAVRGSQQQYLNYNGDQNVDSDDSDDNVSGASATGVALGFLKKNEMLAKSLRKLCLNDLDSYRTMSDESVDHSRDVRLLAECTELEHFECKWCLPHLTPVVDSFSLLTTLHVRCGDASLAAVVAAARRLRNFSVAGHGSTTPLDNKVLAALSSLPQLSELKLMADLDEGTHADGPRGTAWHEHFRSGFAALQTLTMSSCGSKGHNGSGGPNWVDSVGKLPRLQQLRVLGAGSSLSSEGSSSSSSSPSTLWFPALEEVEFRNVCAGHVTRLSEVIAKAPLLCRVIIENSGGFVLNEISPCVTVLRLDKSIDTMRLPVLNERHTHLMKLELGDAREMNPPHQEICALARCPQLVYVDFSNTSVSTVSGLAASSSITELILRHNKKLTTAGLRGVEQMVRLRRLNLMGCSLVTDLTFLALSPSIETLDARWTGAMTAESVSGLETMKALKQVCFPAVLKKQVKPKFAAAGRVLCLG